jgi:putative ATPase
MQDMFAEKAGELKIRKAPLAARMRPTCFDEFVGQEHIVSPGKAFRQAIEADKLPSVIFWGPPGSGKTTLASIIASMTRSFFAPISAVSAGVADLRKVIDQAGKRLGLTGQRTVLFIDEIHRFNKSQQDAVLPFVEDGTVIMIGATTENPSFEVISPLLSRCQVIVLKPLSDQEIKTIILRAIGDSNRGLGRLAIEIEDEGMEYLVAMADHDARQALNYLETAASITKPSPDGRLRLNLDIFKDVIQHHALKYDKTGDAHYDTISALHKTMRGSDPDASLYWLGRMIEAGEDPLYIARRLIRFASEDIGMADPQALMIAMAAQQAVHFVGLPEANLASPRQ